MLLMSTLMFKVTQLKMQVDKLILLLYPPGAPWYSLGDPDFDI